MSTRQRVVQKLYPDPKRLCQHIYVFVILQQCSSWTQPILSIILQVLGSGCKYFSVKSITAEGNDPLFATIKTPIALSNKTHQFLYLISFVLENPHSKI